jgi:hypothetical protein
MQLRKARLCLDCEELHDQGHCPVCASEAYAYLTQWMPAPERRKKPRPASLGSIGVAHRTPVSYGPAAAALHAFVRWCRDARLHLEGAAR